MIWLFSDPHYAHTNICEGISQWKDLSGCRKFTTLEIMNYTIVNAINKYIQQDDEAYCLGDWSFGGINNVWNFRKQIICKTIHLILGNHDDPIRKGKVLPNCSTLELYGNTDLYEYKNITAQDLFTSVSEYETLTYGHNEFILHHHPVEQWKNAEKGSIMLHGHLHGKINNCELNTEYRRMDVGLDWKEFRPYSIDEIVTIMNRRKYLTRSNE